ncbi:MAG: DNA-directed RNA polymerase subunit omega [Nitrospirae bacterium]|nr:MAG: DNA-directed RNA polymerase subunit omega [Nitrospirota bacterium]
MDIISLPIDTEVEGIEGRFRLVNVAALRAKELAQGAEPKIESRAKKVTTLALEEVLSGKVEFLTGEEALRAIEEAEELNLRRLLEESTEETESEDLSELEKDLKMYFPEETSEDSSDAEFDSEE